MSVVASQPSSSGAAPPSPDWPALEQVMARAGRENFPVASRLLPPAQRAHLRAAQGQAPSLELALWMLRTLIDATGRPLAGSAGSPIEAGIWVLEAAFSAVLRSALSPD